MEKKTITLKAIRLPDAKGQKFSQAKYLGRIAEVICSLLVLQGKTDTVTEFINSSLPEIVDLSGEVVTQVEISEEDE